MEREIDLTPRHLIDWLKADISAGTRSLDVRATREFVGEQDPATGEGLDAEDEMAVLTTVGLLEVSPARGGHRWVLRLRVEDPIGSHLPDDGSVPDGPEEIGLEEFEGCFLAGDGVDAAVTFEADSAADGRGFARLLSRILADRHSRQ
jgi:hypothetical protein